MEDPGTPEENGGEMTLEEAVTQLKALQAEMQKEKQERERHDGKTEDDTPENLKSLAQALWDTIVPPNFKMPHLPTFDGKSDPLEHLMAVSTQTAIIGAEEHLK
ncbi:hypothetical protein L195_g030060 [Trifolium pratense]|uniref:Uncharacterized protein n=1 Tax=Trifolium pratense TaxID=57577 RepID=A0A2K3L6H9_TRIPR|nr:hypothetical protein L195_g030060 [Trifolium pratense]